MSSQEQEDVALGSLLFDEVEDGDAMDFGLLGSCDHDDGELDR